MVLTRWRNPVQRKTSRRHPERGARFRPAVEALEDRTLLASGTLDPTFGVGGQVITALGPGLAPASSMAVQPDGKIVVAGSVSNGSNLDFFVARYNPDGSLDDTFGTGGVVTTDFRSGDDVARGLVLQADGKILVVGSAATPAISLGDLALARYNPDGILDTGFGTDGLVLTPFDGTFSSAEAVALHPDGGFVVAGSARPGFVLPGGGIGIALAQNITLARYNADGSLNADFGAGGTVVVTTPFFGEDNSASGVAVQADGKIVVVGTSETHLLPALPCYIDLTTEEVFCPIFPTSALVLARFNADGSTDAGFGQDGAVVELFAPQGASGSGVVLQPDGRIVVAGSANGDFAVARYLEDGSRDSTFGTDGLVLTDFGGRFDQARGLVLQADGRIVVAGSSRSFSFLVLETDFALVRYNADGSLDPTFGTDGLVLTDFGGLDAALAIALDPDGRIVVVGDTHTPDGDALALARYLP